MTTNTPYGYAYYGVGIGRFNFQDDDFWIMLLTNSYVPDYDAHEYLTSAQTFQISGAGYTAGGRQLQSTNWTYSAGDNRAVLTADDVTWLNASFLTRRAVVYKKTGDAATSCLLCCIDFEVDKQPSSEAFNVRFPDGVFSLNGPL